MNKNKDSFKIVFALIKFSLPLILSGMLQQLYNWADAFIVGNVEGERALAAVGSTSSPINFFVTIMTGFTIGLSVLTARKFGEKNTDDIPKIMSVFSVYSAVIFIVISILGIIFAKPFLQSLNTTPDTIDLAVDYIKIIFIGFPFLAIYNVYSATLRGIGDSKTPFFSILISSAVNVILDIYFVAYLHLGIKGAATATIISQIIMSVFTIIYSYKKHLLTRFEINTKTFASSITKEGIKYGIPPMIQSCISSFGSLILQNFMNGFGTPTVVAITTAYRIDTLVMLPIINLGSGISTFTSQGYGEGDTYKISKTLKAGISLSLIVSVLLTVLVIPTGGKLISLFGANDDSVKIGSDFFFRIACFYPIFGLSTALRGYLEGIGDLVYSSTNAVICLVIRIVASYIMKPFFGNMVIAYAEMISWSFLFVLYLLRTVKKKNKFRSKPNTL